MSKEFIEELRATFDYHPDGYLIRKETGEPCGRHANHHDGYAYIGVLKAHRLIYAIVHGEVPSGEVDHINGDRVDNRIENLREVSRSENQHNYKIPNISGFTGVYWDTQARKWHTQIWVNNRLIYLGLFEDFEEAVQARKMAKIKYHPSSPEAARYVRELFPCGA